MDNGSSPATYKLPSPLGGEGLGARGSDLFPLPWRERDGVRGISLCRSKDPPTLTLPRRGGGNKKNPLTPDPSPPRGEGRKGGSRRRAVPTRGRLLLLWLSQSGRRL